MTAPWILVGIILAAAAVPFLWRYATNVIVFVLMIFARVVFERKFVSNLISHCYERDQERTEIVLAVIGWGIVIGTVAAIGAAIILLFYFLSHSL